MNKAILLEELKIKVSAANLPLKDTATNLVFGKGNSNAEIMILGEAPGANEDLQGIPFVGAAGKELDKLLNLINLTLDDIYVANILKYRPPNNRDPNPDEIRAHTPFLIEQIKIIQPKFIVTLGNYATKFVLADCVPNDMKKIGGITSLHGNVIVKNIEGLNVKVFPLYHPAAVIYRREWYKDLEADFLKLGELLKEA